MDLKVGRWYIVAGRGAMRLLTTPNKHNVIEMFTPGETKYWATPDQLVRPVDDAWLDRHEADGKARGYDMSWVPGVRKDLCTDK